MAVTENEVVIINDSNKTHFEKYYNILYFTNFIAINIIQLYIEQ